MMKILNRDKSNEIDGLYHDINRYSMDDLMSRINRTLGSRNERLKTNPDNYQNFWLGVLEAIPKATKTANPIPYLISKGYFMIHQKKRSENRHSYVAYCPNCGEFFNFTANECPACKGDLEYFNRRDDMGSDVDGGFIPQQLDRDITLQLTIEQFVDQLPEGRDKYIAKRWLLDRIDLLVDNYCKELAMEIGIHSTNVAKRITRIKSAFRIWYNE